MTKLELTRRHLLKTVPALGATAAIAPSLAQAAGLQSLNWIIYQAPGGLIDGSTRAIQPFLKQNGFDSTVEYVEGASGRIARAQLFRTQQSQPTIMTEATPEEVMGQVLYNAAYKVDEFQPVFGWFRNAFNICALKTSPFKTFADFVAAAKTRKVTIGTFGKGSPSHLQLVILSSKLGLNLQFVHFNGGALAYTAVAGGHIEAAVGGSTSVQWQSTLNFLVTFRAERDPALPNVPTSKELGYDITPVNEVIYANAGPNMPAADVQALAAAFGKVFSNPDAIAAQKKLGVFPAPLTQAELRQNIQNMYGLVDEYKTALLS